MCAETFIHFAKLSKKPSLLTNHDQLEIASIGCQRRFNIGDDATA
jgi:hypothetical protein